MFTNKMNAALFGGGKEKRGNNITLKGLIKRLRDTHY